MWEGGIVTTDPHDGSLQVEEALLLQHRAERHLQPVLRWVFDLLTLWTGFDRRVKVRRATSYSLAFRYVPRFWHNQDEKRNNPDWKSSYQIAPARSTWLHLLFMAVPIFCITNSWQDFSVRVCVEKVWACDSVYLSLRSSRGRKASGGWSTHSKWVNPPPVVLSNNPWKCANRSKMSSFRSTDVKNKLITQI